MEGTSRPKVPTWALALIVPVLAVIVAIITLNVTSDDSGGSGNGSSPGSPDTANAVVIKDFAFSPTPLGVAAGASLTVTNDDGAAHTLTADDGKFDTGDLAGGEQTTITIDAPGKYAYHCDIHNYMTGVIEAS